MNHFNICPSCLHRNNCALTAQKDKVWSCSEFDELKPKETIIKKLPQLEQNQLLELV